MFEAIRNSKKIIQICLGLVALTFIFVGANSMQGGNTSIDAASVGGSKISVQELEIALRQRQEQLQQSMGAAFRPEMLQLPEFKMSALNTLISRRLLNLEAEKNNLGIDKAALQAFIADIPQFQVDGRFSKERYDTLLRMQNKSPAQFEAEARQDLILQQLVGAVTETSFVSETQVEAMLRLQTEARFYRESRIAAQQFAQAVTLDPAAAQKFYDENKAQYETPQRVKAEFVTLSLSDFLPQVKITEEALKARYAEEKEKRYQQPEERRISHILIQAKTEAEQAKAKAKASEILNELKKAPEKFAELAKQESQDPGSASKGGDLGFVAPGVMVKPFEEAAFKQKEGELSDLVQSDFGYHIIKVSEIKAAKTRPFEEVRGEISSELTQQAAVRQFAEESDTFKELVFTQIDSLQAVAEKFKLKIQQSEWLIQRPDPANMGLLADEKVLKALFDSEAISSKRNLEVLEIAPNTFLAARVIDAEPAAIKAFAEVKGDIETLLRAQEMAKLAKQSGEERLAELKKGTADALTWSAEKSVSRSTAQQISPSLLKALFSANVEKLPAYLGESSGADYLLYKIDKVSTPEKFEEAERNSLRNEYATILAEEELGAYLAVLRQRYPVKINQGVLGVKNAASD